MKKKLLFSVILLAIATLLPKQSKAYDFSAVAPSGQTLYYNIHQAYYNYGEDYAYVYLTWPCDTATLWVNTWTGYTKPSGNLTIPSTVEYNGTTFTVIAVQGFYGCDGLTSVTIPNTVRQIYRSAFANCTNLSSVSFAGSPLLKVIGNSAFYKCTSLTSFNIPSSVTHIYDYAFNQSGLTSTLTLPYSLTVIGNYVFCYTDITSVYIPGSVYYIGNNPFADCPSITLIEVDSESRYFDSRNNCNAIIGNNPISGYQPTDNLFGDIDESADWIEGYSSFPDVLVSGCKNTVIPNTVETIGYNAFEGCTGLTGTISIPSSVVYICGYAFAYCTGLTSITIPDTMSSIGNSAFKDCTGITTVNFNATNCSTMGSSDYPCFEGCTALATLNIGSEVTKIPDYAFKSCTRLTSLTLPGALTYIGNGAFSSCTGITTVNYNATNCTTMKATCFEGCSALATVNIGEQVAYMPASSFANCTGLTTVNFNATNCSTMGSSSSDDRCFKGCSAFTTLNIGSNVTKIPSYGFWGTALTSLTIPSSVTTIGNSAFAQCGGLTDIKIPNSVTSIGAGAFSGCSGCTNLRIGNSVTSIGESAFANCSNIEEIHSLATFVPTLGADAFNGVSFRVPVYVPCGCQNAYYIRWTYFSNIIEDCDPQGIDDIAADKVKIRTRAGEIIVEGTDANSKVVVYDLKGCIVHRGRIDGPIHINAAGVYMVKIDNLQPEKIVVR